MQAQLAPARVVVAAKARTVTPDTSCAVEAATELRTLQSMLVEWDDVAKLAGSTPRINLAPQISNLQAIRRDVSIVEETWCTRAVRRELLGLMDHTIQGYLDFMAQRPEYIVDESFDKAGDAMVAFEAEIARASGRPVILTPTPVIQARVNYRVLGEPMQMEVSYTDSWGGRTTRGGLVPWEMKMDVPRGEMLTMEVRIVDEVYGLLGCEIIQDGVTIDRIEPGDHREVTCIGVAN